MFQLFQVVNINFRKYESRDNLYAAEKQDSFVDNSFNYFNSYLMCIATQNRLTENFR